MQAIETQWAKDIKFYAEITIMKTLLKLKYKSFVQISLSFEFWKKCQEDEEKRERKTCEVLMPSSCYSIMTQAILKILTIQMF